jgi:hypothetical protein
MAEQSHLDILKQGVEVWNRWRQKQSVIPDLREADLADAELDGINLRNARLEWANLSKAHLARATLDQANLYKTFLAGAYLLEASIVGSVFTETNLVGANLSDSLLIRSIFKRAKLAGANLSGTNLGDAKFDRADLTNTDLTKTDLLGTIFLMARLSGTDFRLADMAWATFASLDLSQAKGLDEVTHRAPSTIGTDTLFISKGNIPEIFLRGAGVPDVLIDYFPSLVQQPLDFNSVFISYSSKDEIFAIQLHGALQAKGVRCWFAPENLKIGDKFSERIEKSIWSYDKLLLILSQDSISSTWVEREVDAALERERREERLVLFPIRLDDAVRDSQTAWARAIRRSRHIGDFRGWKNDHEYQRAFDRLLSDLKTNDDP